MATRKLVLCSFLSFTALLVACGGTDDTSGATTAGAGGGAAGTSTQGGAGGSAGDSGGAGEAGMGGSTAGAGAATLPFTCPGGTVVAGLNDGFEAGGLKRKFYADFPKDTSKPLAVVFSWHGFGDTAENMRAFSPKPDIDPDMPFVLVTPDDTNLTPLGMPLGLDWEIFSGKSDADNREGALFESVLGCLGQSNAIDASRIYIMGFSAGAITTNMLYSRYQGQVAAALAFSGAWFNDEAEVKGVNTLGFKIDFSWDDLDPAKGGMLLLTHGGPNDQFGMLGQQIIDFEKSYQSAVPFLTAAKRPFIDCAHTNGHQPHPQMTSALMVKYFKAHRLGEPSPYLGGKLDPSFPGSCTLHEP
jgi:predicted esterase